MAARVELRSITSEGGNRLLRIIRRGSGSVVTWRRAQIVLLAVQRMPAAKIAEVAFTDADTVRELIHNFNRDGFDALYPRYRGGRPRTFSLPERQQIKRIALSSFGVARLAAIVGVATILATGFGCERCGCAGAARFSARVARSAARSGSGPGELFLSAREPDHAGDALGSGGDQRGFLESGFAEPQPEAARLRARCRNDDAP